MKSLGPVQESMKGSKELYEVEGNEYFVVSTVNLDEEINSLNVSLINLSAAMVGTATEGEETIAFEADKEGNIIDWLDRFIANGEGSKENVLNQIERYELDKIDKEER